jgi:hypothetical protein
MIKYKWLPYENIEDFANFIGQSVLNKLQNPS